MKTSRNKILLALGSLGFWAAVLPSIAKAQITPAPCNPGAGGINLGNCLQLSDSSLVSAVYNNPAFLVNLIVRNVFVIAGIIMFALILLAGFKIAMAGKGGKQGLDDAKNILTAVGLGFLVMFGAYWIVQIVKVITGADITL